MLVREREALETRGEEPGEEAAAQPVRVGVHVAPPLVAAMLRLSTP